MYDSAHSLDVPDLPALPMMEAVYREKPAVWNCSNSTPLADAGAPKLS
jgi:hypothetical protein